MADKTKIEWTDATWNPVRGCSMVSPGCEHCYAMRVAHRFSGEGRPYEGLTKLTDKGPVWNGNVRLEHGQLDKPLRWRKPRRIFVNSMSDTFHEKLSDRDIGAIFGVMAAAPQHTFQVLTKRPERMLDWFRWLDKDDGGRPDTADHVITDMFGVPELNSYLTRNTPDSIGEVGKWDHLISDPPAWPLPNVWLGVSVENQKAADERVPLLLQAPAAVRFVSAEPLLGHVKLNTGDWGYCVFCNTTQPGGFDDPCATPGCGRVITRYERSALDQIDWVIVGGESGPGARAMHPDWARSIRDQCATADVAFHFKQWGAWLPEHHELAYQKTSGTERRVVDGFYRVGKKLAGRVLDGKTWDQWPQTTKEI